jgi:hypothetical protein
MNNSKNYGVTKTMMLTDVVMISMIQFCNGFFPLTLPMDCDASVNSLVTET